MNAQNENGGGSSGGCVPIIVALVFSCLTVAACVLYVFYSNERFNEIINRESEAFEKEINSREHDYKQELAARENDFAARSDEMKKRIADLEEHNKALQVKLREAENGAMKLSANGATPRKGVESAELLEKKVAGMEMRLDALEKKLSQPTAEKE
ncbi:MAG: hypothetical protein JXR97_15300 [Planctomycetes bacterium]|nr:hypothetical protein [Planctomycetota bacterium]